MCGTHTHTYISLAAKKDFIVGADINMFKELAASGREGVRGMVKHK